MKAARQSANETTPRNACSTRISYKNTRLAPVYITCSSSCCCCCFWPKSILRSVALYLILQSNNKRGTTTTTTTTTTTRARVCFEREMFCLWRNSDENFIFLLGYSIESANISQHFNLFAWYQQQRSLQKGGGFEMRKKRRNRRWLQLSQARLWIKFNQVNL